MADKSAAERGRRGQVMSIAAPPKRDHVLPSEDCGSSGWPRHAPDNPLPHAGPAARPTVSPADVLVALGHTDVPLGAKSLDPPEVALAVPALGNSGPLLRVLKRKPVQRMAH